MDDRITFRDWPYLVVPCVVSAFGIGLVLADGMLGAILAFFFGLMTLMGFYAWTRN